MLSDLAGAVKAWRRRAVPRYDYEEICVACDNFSSRRRLGGGATSSVYAGLIQGSDVAVKVVDVSQTHYDDDSFDEELRVLSSLHHPNIVELLGWGQHDEKRFLIYEFLSSGDLAKKLWRSRNGQAAFSWKQRMSVAVGASRGLAHMVSRDPKAYHCDIKAANILLDAAGHAKVADFGVAGTERHLQWDVDEGVVRGSPGYTCPLYLESGGVTEQSEVYSFGVVLLELLLNVPVAKKKDDGTLSYPLREKLGIGKPGVHVERVMRHLDAAASWPEPLARKVASLALRCVSVPEHGANPSRPRFEEIADLLEEMYLVAAGQPVRAGAVPPTDRLVREETDEDVWGCGTLTPEDLAYNGASLIDVFTDPRSPTRAHVPTWGGKGVETVGWWNLPEVWRQLNNGLCCKIVTKSPPEQKVNHRRPIEY